MELKKTTLCTTVLIRRDKVDPEQSLKNTRNLFFFLQRMMVILISFGDNLADSYTIRGLIGLDEEISKISLRHRLQIEA